YSTAALHTAITHGRVDLSAQTTIIHDEAALASTREQQRLLDAVEASGARLILVGDGEQNQPVGAGGLWPHLQATADDTGAQAELTRNQRAQDPADRREQELFRHGHAERALRGYAARDRVHLDHELGRAEDQALDAAHADRAAGRSTIVIAQTSNDHLDALNARAQAIRHQAGELGEESLPFPGRPYELRAGDHVQIRHTIQHPDHGPLRNGTTAQTTDIDPDARTVQLGLADSTELTLTDEQAADADLRLAYVQHPFPAQGQTTDTTHLIIAEHATREGSYVAITRARQQTHIYAATIDTDELDSDRLATLAERMNSTEPELASIEVPLRHDQALALDRGRQPDPVVRAEPAGAVEEPVRHARAVGMEGHPLPAGVEPRRTLAVAASVQLEPDVGGEPLERDEQAQSRGWPGRTAAPEPEHMLEPDRQPPWEI
ncbi:MAG: AAA family ATPase, partial [Solirubrobacteraceae bacterium]